jgi:quinol monooxygenase YgiN
MICRIYDVPGATLDQYDQVNEQLGSHKPDGAHAHICCRADDGFRVIEVWDSTDAIDLYMQSGLGEAMQQYNLPEPKITDLEVHNLDWTD